MPRKKTGKPKGRPTTIRDQFIPLDPEETLFKCKFDGAKVKVGSLSAHTKTEKHKAAQALQPKEEREPEEEPEEAIKEEIKEEKPKKQKKEKEPEKPKKEKEPEKPKKPKKEPPEHVEGKVTSSVYLCPDGARVNLKSIKLHFGSEMHKKYEKKNNVIIDYPTEQIKEKRAEKTKLKLEAKEKHAKITQKLRHTIKFTEEKPEAKEKEEIPELPEAPEWREIEGEDRGTRGNRYYDYEIARARYVDKKEEVEKLKRKQEAEERIFIPPTLQNIINKGKETTLNDIKDNRVSQAPDVDRLSKSFDIKYIQIPTKRPLAPKQRKFLIKQTKAIYGMLEDALITGIEDYVVNAERNEEIDDKKVHGLKKKKLLEDVYLEAFPIPDLTKFIETFEDTKLRRTEKRAEYNRIINESIWQDKRDKSGFISVINAIMLYLETIETLKLTPLHDKPNKDLTPTEKGRELQIIEAETRFLFHDYIVRTFITTLKIVRKFLLLNVPEPLGSEVKGIMKNIKRERKYGPQGKKEKEPEKEDDKLDDFLKDAFKFD